MQLSPLFNAQHTTQFICLFYFSPSFFEFSKCCASEVHRAITFLVPFSSFPMLSCNENIVMDTLPRRLKYYFSLRIGMKSKILLEFLWKPPLYRSIPGYLQNGFVPLAHLLIHIFNIFIKFSVGECVNQFI